MIHTWIQQRRDIATKKLVDSCDRFEGGSICFSPDGKWLANYSSTSTKLRSWLTSADGYEFKLRPPYDRMNITGVKGLTTTTISMLKTLGAIDTQDSFIRILN
jgi:hypothetical protein